MAVRNARLMAGRPAKPASERPEARGRVSFTDMPLISLTRGIGQQYVLGHPPLQPFTQGGAPDFAADRFRKLGYKTDLARIFVGRRDCANMRSEEHTSELQSLMRISYAVFCLQKKNKKE